MIFQFISFRDWITIRDLDQWWSSTDQEAVCFERYTAETLRKSMGYKQYYETPTMSVGYIIVNTAYVNNMTRRPVTYHAYPPGHNWDIVVVASTPNMSCIFVVVITISPHFDRHEYEATTSKHSKHRKQRLRGIIKSTQTKSIYYCNNIQLIALWQNHSLYIMHLVSPCTLPCKNHPSCHYLTSMPGTKISVICKNK